MQRVSSESLSLWALFTKINSLTDNEVELILSTASPLLENQLALKILKDEVQNGGKKISFFFEDKNFEHLGKWLNPPPGEANLAAPPPPPTNGRPKFTMSWAFLNWRPPLNRRLIVLVVPVLVLIFSFFGLYYFSKAKVTLVVDSEPLLKPIEVTADRGQSSVGKDPPIIPALAISTDLSDSESSPSSGKKEVGDKATGTVTIYNKTTEATTLPAATLIIKGRISGDDLRFLTKGAVTISARTADTTAISGYQPGTTAVEIVAEKLGDEYNLPSGTTFNVGNKSTSDFIAQSNADFTGGSRRQVTVVTVDDQKKLLDQTTASLKDNLKKGILEKVVSGQFLDETSITYEVLNKNFDKSVGDEADRLTLSLKLRAKALSFLQSDLKSLSASLLGSFVPDGYELYGQQQDVEIVSSQLVNDRLQVSARAKGFIVPRVDQDEVRRRLVGQRVGFANDYLSHLNRISSFAIGKVPDFSFWPFLPFRLENLQIEVVRK